MYYAAEVSVVDCAITNVITADRNINDKVVRAIKTKVHKLDITLLVACGRRRRHLVVDVHRVACVAGQLRQDLYDMIVASGGSRVFFATAAHSEVSSILHSVRARHDRAHIDIFPTLYEVRSNYALTRVCRRTITCLLLRLRTAVVLAFSLTTHEEHRY